MITDSQLVKQRALGTMNILVGASLLLLFYKYSSENLFSLVSFFAHLLALIGVSSGICIWISKPSSAAPQLPDSDNWSGSKRVPLQRILKNMTESYSDETYWNKRVEFNRRTLIPMIGATLIITSGPGILELTDLQGSIETPTSLSCFSDLTAHKTNERYPTLYFSDASARELGACSKPVCRYQGWGADVGKTASICLSGGTLVSIEIEGVSKLTRAGLLAELDNLILWRKIGCVIGLLCLGTFVYMERNRLVLVLRGENH